MDMAWSDALLGWAHPKAALERTIPVQVVTVGGSTGQRGMGRKPGQGVLRSKLLLWVTGAGP